MPVPLAQTPAAQKLPPVEKKINSVEKSMTCTQANLPKVWNSLDKNIKTTFLDRIVKKLLN